MSHETPEQPHCEISAQTLSNAIEIICSDPSKLKCSNIIINLSKVEINLQKQLQYKFIRTLNSSNVRTLIIKAPKRTAALNIFLKNINMIDGIEVKFESNS